MDERLAPGWPGIPPRWTSSGKVGVGTAWSRNSRVWFTLSHGIFNEIYYPRSDQACVRDMGFLIANGADFFSEEKRHANSKVDFLCEGVPAYRLTNTCNQGRYRIEKRIVSDPERDSILQASQFRALMGNLNDFHLYVLLAPHLANHGNGNAAWVSEYKGVPMIFAQRENTALALACSVPWLKRSVGYVGISDGWQDVSMHKEMTWEYTLADNGNVAMVGEIDLKACSGEFLISLGFGVNATEAGNRALSSLQEGFESIQDRYVEQWQSWQESMPKIEQAGHEELYRVSLAMLRVHEEKQFPGGGIASLSIPWGFQKGDDDLGGYHLVWPRDLVEAAGALLAAGAKEEAFKTLCYLQSTQEEDGHWPQNMWMDGTLYWTGVQIDETALPILLVALAWREQNPDTAEIMRFWPMVKRAATFIVQNGPVTAQDRWEEDPGYSPFTLATEIAALLAAADIADSNSESHAANYLREIADAWNDQIERWTYVSQTDLAAEVGVEGYYVRIAPPEIADAASPAQGFVAIKNRPPGQSLEPETHIVSPDSLALVRFGLRAADDPRILNTIKVIDFLLKTETPYGPGWHRYNDDGYGEHEDGSPFDGTGIGRVWPLLTGERAHYELAANHHNEALLLLETMKSFAGQGELLPEQVWDQPDIPGRELFFGKASGSAMPLVWAHAEYVKLHRSLRDGAVFDMPQQSYQRYVLSKSTSPFSVWRFNNKIREIPKGKILRIEMLESFLLYWTVDGTTHQKSESSDTKIGIHLVDLPTQSMVEGEIIEFSFSGTDAVFKVMVISPEV